MSLKKIFLQDNFLDKTYCKELINFYNNEDTQSEFYNTFVLPLNLNQHAYLVNKINEISLKLNNSIIDYIQIIKRPFPNLGQQLHFDTGREKTTLTSIIYLNDDYIGGNTFFEDGSCFVPKVGRIIFFDGQYYKHGVSEIKKNNRYVLATWFKKNEF